MKQQNFDLLAKVEKAIDVFPRSEIIIEGHTDAYGGDESNQILSQERAESVQQYMINAMRIPSYRLIATGYGETRPISSNETESGRARSREISLSRGNRDSLPAEAAWLRSSSPVQTPKESRSTIPSRNSKKGSRISGPATSSGSSRAPNSDQAVAAEGAIAVHNRTRAAMAALVVVIDKFMIPKGTVAYWLMVKNEL